MAVAANTVATMSDDEHRRQLRRALSTLSPGRAEAVLLHDALGYDLAEVASMTSSTEAAVQSRLVRGRRDLQERFPFGGDEALGLGERGEQHQARLRSARVVERGDDS